MLPKDILAALVHLRAKSQELTAEIDALRLLVEGDRPALIEADTRPERTSTRPALMEQETIYPDKPPKP